MKINNVELTDLDLLDAEVAEKYENAINELNSKAKESTNEGLKLSQIITRECTLIFDFFNSLFGEGTDKKVFGDKTNYKVCLNAFKEVIDFTSEQTKEIEKSFAKYSPARIKR